MCASAGIHVREGQQCSRPDCLGYEGPHDSECVLRGGKGRGKEGLCDCTCYLLQRNFIMEGGAMVLADGGVVCIDEFDKVGV